MLARSNTEGEVAQDRLIRPVAEADVLENHLPQPGRTQRSGVGILHDLQGLLHQLTDALHGRQTTLNLGEPFRQLTQRIKQTLGIEDEGGEDSEAHGTRCHHPSPQGQHQGNSSEGHPFEEGRDAAVEENRSIHSAPVSGTGALKALAVHLLAPKHLDHLQALKVLLKISIELGELLSNPVVGLAVTALQPDHHQGHGNLCAKQQQAKPPFDQQH